MLVHMQGELPPGLAAGGGHRRGAAALGPARGGALHRRATVGGVAAAKGEPLPPLTHTPQGLCGWHHMVQA